MGAVAYTHLQQRPVRQPVDLFKQNPLLRPQEQINQRIKQGELVIEHFGPHVYSASIILPRSLTPSVKSKITIPNTIFTRGWMEKPNLLFRKSFTKGM
jgi:hypothetical protein